jgi:hypothetical protein
VKSLEVEMGRYPIDEVEIEKDDQTLESDNRGFAKRGADQPRQSPIRRKNKLRQEEEELKPKAKRNHKKIQHRLKYDWQGE